MLEFPHILPLALLGPAAWIDFRRHRIPNWLTGTMLAGAFICHFIEQGTTGIAVASGGMLVGFAIFFVAYLRGGMGAGDVKLMAAVGACLGPYAALLATCASLVVGGGMAMLLLSYRYYRGATSHVDALLSARFPYASAIAVGTATALTIKEIPWTL